MFETINNITKEKLNININLTVQNPIQIKYKLEIRGTLGFSPRQ